VTVETGFDAGEQPPHVLGPAAGMEIAEQFGREPGIYRSIFGEPIIDPVVARQHREGNTLFPAGLRQLLDAITPVIQPAEAAHQHETALRDGLLDQQVDRERMPEPPQRGEAHGGFGTGRGSRQRREIAVGV
jgi:hypothetical protein